MKSETAFVPSIRIPVRPGEKFVVNGAVLTLGEDGVEIQNHDLVLMGRDVMLPEDANTPAKRVYYWLMLMYLDAPGREEYRLRLLDDMNDLLNATTLVDVAKSLGLIHRLLQHEDYPKAMASARALMGFEAELLSLAPQERPESMRGYGAYLKVQNVAEPPRAIERRLMGAVTAALIEARDNPNRLSTKFDAILWNKRVWDTFISEISDESNRLPAELKSSIIRLGAWVTYETQMVMDGVSTPDMLIEVNQQVIEGLN